MEAYLLQNEGVLRIYALLAGSFFMLIESLAPASFLVEPFIQRWVRNFGLFLFNLFFLRIALPLTTIGAALLAAQHDWGVAHIFDMPTTLTFLFGMLALDLTVYAWHFCMHHVGFLWRIHAVHHCDKDFDCTTGLRFHPVETFCSILLHCLVIVALGIPASAVIAFEIWSTLASFYTHVNTRTPDTLDRFLRLVVVTQKMHRIHHSQEMRDGMSNLGVLLSIWDRLFGTYRAQPVQGEAMSTTVGLPWFNRHASLSLLGLCALPFNSAPFVSTEEAPPAKP